MSEPEVMAWVEDGVLMLAKWCCGIPWPPDFLIGDWSPCVIAGIS